MFYLAIVNEVLRHCHSWLARQYLSLTQFYFIVVCGEEVAELNYTVRMVEPKLEFLYNRMIVEKMPVYISVCIKFLFCNRLAKVNSHSHHRPFIYTCISVKFNLIQPDMKAIFIFIMPDNIVMLCYVSIGYYVTRNS